jgi:lipoate-protein ligase A
MPLRLLPRLDADGPVHMATDEALLEAAAVPTLRLYRWRPATVSLGYFQDFGQVAAQLPPAIPVVRRITGGGAIWHDHEVTYCLVGRLGEHGLPARVRDCYPLLHGAVLAALAARSAGFGLQDRTLGDRRYHQEPRCFASPAADDLVAVAGGKVLGSAGRARGASVLVHGSLKLASNPWDGDAVAGCGLEWDEAASLLQQAIAAALGEPLADGALEPREIATRERIRGERYGDQAWVRERKGPRP